MLSEIEKKYASLFLRFLKNEGDLYKWRKQFFEHGTFEKTIKECVNPRKIGSKRQINGKFITTPFEVLGSLKGFYIIELYRDIDSYLVTRKIENFYEILKNNFYYDKYGF